MSKLSLHVLWSILDYVLSFDVGAAIIGRTWWSWNGEQSPKQEDLESKTVDQIYKYSKMCDVMTVMWPHFVTPLVGYYVLHLCIAV